MLNQVVSKSLTRPGAPADRARALRAREKNGALVGNLTMPLHVVQISFFVDPERRTPPQLLEDWYALALIAHAAASSGVRVTVVQASMVPGRIRQSDVTFHFVAPDSKTAMLTKSSEFQSLLHDLAPDVLHMHGLGFPHETLSLHTLTSGIPMLLQDHAERVPRLWKRRPWRQRARIVAGVSFCARQQAEPFIRARVFDPKIRVLHRFEYSDLSASSEEACRHRLRAGGLEKVNRVRRQGLQSGTPTGA